MEAKLNEKTISIKKKKRSTTTEKYYTGPNQNGFTFFYRLI